MPDLETDFYSKLANSLANELFARHLHLVIQISQYDRSKELEQIRELKTSMCDGLFISPTASTNKDMDETRENIPVVCFDDASAEEENRFDSVETPDQSGMLDIIAHLLSLNRRKIAIVGLPLSNHKLPEPGATIRRNRSAFAFKALDYFNLPVSDAGIRADWGVESGRNVAHHLVNQGMPYDALCCMSDSLALGMLRGLAECGIKVPEDVAVTGFDGINPGSYITPTLTTVAVDFKGMARTAIQMMSQRILNTTNHSDDHQHVIVGYQLFKRESTLGIQRLKTNKSSL